MSVLFLEPALYSDLQKYLPDACWRNDFDLRPLSEFSPREEGYLLTRSEELFILKDSRHPTWKNLFTSYTESSWLYRLEKSKNSKELLRDALKKSGKSVFSSIVDLTGGFGQDSFMMSYWGYEVTTYEKNPLLYFMMKKAFEDFQQKHQEMAQSMKWTISFGDSRRMQIPGGAIIYLDPMFDEFNEKTKPTKEMEFLRSLLSERTSTDDINVWLEELSKTGASKIIVKRSLKSSELKAPEFFVKHNLQSASTRLDVFNRVL